MLQENFGISDPAGFIASAKEQGIGDLLSNPQTLRMLVEAVNQLGEPVFPRSRTETFDLACRKLLSEHNDEHRLVSRTFVGMEGLVRAAGRLCAVQLLTGGQGYRLPGGASEPDFPHLEEIAAEDGEKLRHVVSTKLFHTPSEGHIAPIHRQVAEFLAARYLAGLISNGLPLRRVLSLMTGYDGVIVSELRGLSAWLAAHGKSGRAEIVARDPLGTLLYGDVRDWPVHDKVLLLEHLNRESKKNPWSVGAIKSESRFGDISTQDMAGEIRQRLESSERDDAWQSFIWIVVEMLRFGDPLPGIAEILLDVARDESRWPRIRRSAIDAFVKHQEDRSKAHSGLKCLLADINAERVRDPDVSLLRCLLGELHPESPPAPEVPKYLRAPGKNESISRAAVGGSPAERPGLEGVFEEKPGRFEETRVRDADLSVDGENERQQRQAKERQYLRPHEAALRENQAEPGLLYKLALVYLGALPRFRGEDPKSRLFDLLGDDHDLVEAVLQGLRGSIDRGDIPGHDEVIKLSCESKRHILAVPIVAGLEERARAAPDHQVHLDGARLRLALAIQYTEPHWSVYMGGDRPADQKSLWFPHVLGSHPHIVSEVLIKFADAQLRNGADGVDGLYELAHSRDHREVAQLASLRLLETFPVRCRQAQLKDLLHLLHSPVLNSGDALANLIERKLANRSMNTGQRVYWLAAGMLTYPDKYVEELDACVAASKRRIDNLERFAGALFDMPPRLLQFLDISALKLLIRRVGANCEPGPASRASNAGEDGTVMEHMETRLCVRDFIHRLASDPSERATKALRDLLLDGGLKAWRPNLVNAADQQIRARREGDFRHCGVEQALATLGNQKPANAADLAALITDQLFGIARNIRDGNTSDWRQYWNVDSRNRPRDSRPEDACRDALLSDLQQRLSRLGIDAHPEGRYADDKRADIRVSCNGFNVPVEIKKSCHRDVWSAIEKQLVVKYARDPRADGYGIYVVFWFGNTEHCRPTPGTAGVPRSAAELERRLRESLSEEIRRKISVCAIDVAKPQA